MPIRVRCSGCQNTLKVPEKFAGKRIRCPVCQTAVNVPGEPVAPSDTATDSLAVTSAVPKLPVDTDSPAVAEEETYRLSEPEPDPASEPAPPARVVGKKVRAKSDRVGRSDDNFEAPSRRSRGTPSNSASEGGWRDHLIWFLLVAMIPLAFSIAFPGRSTDERIDETTDLHPEIIDPIETAESRDAVFDAIPEHQIVGAHLPYESQLHWAYALIATLVFLSVLSVMSVGGEAGPLRLIWTGVLTGTLGIFLLLAVQWIASATMWFHLRGGGIIMILFYLVKLIGFSYRAALDPENGFILSFLGFTLGVGFCEELCKALPVMFFLRKSDNAGWRAACLVGMASGIGFGISEGISYSADFYNGVAPFLTYLVRFSSCVALHAIWAGAVAILMRENQDHLFHDGFDWEDALNFLVQYLLIAMVLHGLYDTLLKRDHHLLALAIAAGSFAWLGWLASNRRREEAA